MSSRSLLDRLEELCNVDVDDVSTELIKSLPIVPHNQTSNQFIITDELLKPTNENLLKELVREHGKEGWEKVYDMAAVRICVKNIPYISGRLLVQVSPRYLNDHDEIVRQCHSYSKAFDELGVSRERFAIKLPFSGAAATAAVELNREGIRTLATAVFSLEQAIAASQSNCLFISPYYNEIAAHLDPSLRPDVRDPALEHPMSARVIHILEAYAKAYKETGREQPVMVIASHFNVTEVLAMAELGCQHVTVSASNLKVLIETPDSLPPLTTGKPKHPYATLVTAERLKTLSHTDALAGSDWNGKLASMETDFLAEGGAKVDEFIAKDPIVSRRFNDAIEFFLEAENRAKVAIEGAIADTKLS